MVMKIIRVRRDFRKLPLKNKIKEAIFRLETQTGIKTEEDKIVLGFLYEKCYDGYTGEIGKEHFPLLEVELK